MKQEYRTASAPYGIFSYFLFGTHGFALYCLSSASHAYIHSFGGFCIITMNVWLIDWLSNRQAKKLYELLNGWAGESIEAVSMRWLCRNNKRLADDLVDLYMVAGKQKSRHANYVGATIIYFVLVDDSSLGLPKRWEDSMHDFVSHCLWSKSECFPAVFVCSCRFSELL